MPTLSAFPRADTVPLPTLSGLPQVIPYDDRPIAPIGMIALKIYAFGGLAFMVATCITAISYWFWIVVIKGKYADSPPWLDLHPERMRAKEVARIARLKARKEEKLQEKQRREQEKYMTPPPIRLIKRNNRDRSCSAPVSGVALPHPQVPVHKPIHNPPASNARPRKSSLSTASSKPTNNTGKRVSWASSTATLDVFGVASAKPIEEKKISPLPLPADFERHSNLLPIPSQKDVLRELPRARVSEPRISAAIDPRARRGPGMIAVTTPEVANSWARPAERVGR